MAMTRCSSLSVVGSWAVIFTSSKFRSGSLARAAAAAAASSAACFAARALSFAQPAQQRPRSPRMTLWMAMADTSRCAARAAAGCRLRISATFCLRSDSSRASPRAMASRSMEMSQLMPCAAALALMDFENSSIDVGISSYIMLIAKRPLTITLE